MKRHGLRTACGLARIIREFFDGEPLIVRGSFSARSDDRREPPVSSSPRVQAVTMRRSFPAEAPAPGLARRAASEFARGEGVDADTLAAIALCVSEAVTNVVMHAYREGGGSGAVEVEAHRPNGYLCLYVRDEGCGMRPRADSPGLGLGLPLISQVASAVEYRTPSDGGTELVMRFDLPHAA